MASQDRLPTADGSITGTWTPTPASPATHWDKVDEITPNDADYTTCSAVGRCRFTFSVFSIPAGATINYLRLTYRHYKTASQAANIRSALGVGGNNYDITDPGVNPSNGVWNTRTYDYTLNPKTGIAWTVDDINGVSANALTQFGLYSSDASPTVRGSMCYATVDYNEASTATIMVVD